VSGTHEVVWVAQTPQINDRGGFGEMAMQTQQHFHREYEIQLTNNPPQWQAAIYPTRAGLPPVAWEQMNIWAANPDPALTMAIHAINKALSN
jgi:hypothetical protein